MENKYKVFLFGFAIATTLWCLFVFIVGQTI